MKLYFSLRITLTHLVLALVALRLGYWQWERHLEKKSFIAEVQSRVELPPLAAPEFVGQATTDPSSVILRRVVLAGRFHHKHEIILKNRKRGDEPGFHLVTPFTVDGLDQTLLVNRGFVPYSFLANDKLSKVNRPQRGEFIGLVKESMMPPLLGPRDRAPAPGEPRREQWLRVDVKEIEKQLPATLLPVYVEMMSDDVSLTEVPNRVIEQGGGGARDDLLLLANKEVHIFSTQDQRPEEFPIATFDTVIPPGRHLGYVYEWSFIALIILLLGVWRQARPQRN